MLYYQIFMKNRHFNCLGSKVKNQTVYKESHVNSSNFDFSLNLYFSFKYLIEYVSRSSRYITSLPR